jgi:hypothetical protein
VTVNCAITLTRIIHSFWCRRSGLNTFSVQMLEVGRWVGNGPHYSSNYFSVEDNSSVNLSNYQNYK